MAKGQKNSSQALAVLLNGKHNYISVIIITTQCFAPKIGGIESLMTGMAEAMAETGEDLLVLADGVKTKKDKEYKFKIKRFNAWKPIRRIQKANYLKKISKQYKIKAIFADSWKSTEYLKNLKIKVIVLAHGTEIPKQYWNMMLDILRFKKNRIFKAYSNSSHIIANSNYTKDLMEISLNIKREKIKVIHPGIDIYKDFISDEDDKKIQRIINKRFPVITTLARIEKRKGHKFVLNAISEIKKEFPNILYLIAGKGPYLEEIKNHSRRLGLIDNIYFLGWITEPEKSLVLKNSDLFVMTPSIVGESVEGFGMSFIDAAFHGVASIGTDSGGISDAIVDDVTGLLCKVENQKDITNKILALLKNEKKRKELGINGKKRAHDIFSWKIKIHEFMKIVN